MDRDELDAPINVPPEERERIQAQVEAEYSRAKALQARLRSFGIYLRMSDNTHSASPEDRAEERQLLDTSGWIHVGGRRGVELTLAAADVELLLRKIEEAGDDTE